MVTQPKYGVDEATRRKGYQKLKEAFRTDKAEGGNRQRADYIDTYHLGRPIKTEKSK